jgi:small subunit ribosomal protein S20
MPVSQTAKRALRSSKRKAVQNKLIKTRLEVAIRDVKKKKTKKAAKKAVSEIDRAAKKGTIHRNKAARLKSKLAHLLS